MRSRRLLVAGLICFSLSFVRCTRDERIPLVVYSPHGKEMLTAFEVAYEQEHPDIDVQWLDMGSQDVYDRIRTERANPQADIWWGAPWLMFVRAEKESLLERYIPSWAGAISDEYRSNGGYWFGTFITPEVIMYNSKVISEEDAPHDWDDLLDDEWRGKIIIRYPLASGTMRTIFAVLIQRKSASDGNTSPGFLWLSGLDANTKTYASDPTQLYLKIAREEGFVTLWNLPDVIIQRDVNGYPFGYVIPASGTPMIIDGIAIVRGTKKRDLAAGFYEFVTSREALVRQAGEFFRIPARNDIRQDLLPEWLKEVRLKPMEVDWSSIAVNEREWMRRWDETVKGRGEENLRRAREN